MVKEQGRVSGNLHVALDEALGSKGRVRRHLDVVLAGKFDQVRLDVVRVVFNLEGCRLDLRVREHVEEEGAAVVAHSDALG